MIIAAYAGCGKTYMSKERPDECIEVQSMPYARILPEIKEDISKSIESEKASLYHINNPLFPYNMIPEILEAEKNSKYVIIPTIKSIIDVLINEHDRKVVLCYPEDDMEDEYRRRYMERGNSEEFCKIFVDGMKEFLKSLKEIKDAVHLPLAKGEYLLEKYDCFEEICSESSCDVIEQAQIDELRQEIHNKRNDIWFEAYFLKDHVFYKVENIEDPEERLFVYNFGKRAYASSDCVIIRSYDFDVTKEAEKLHIIPKIVDKKGLMDALDKHEKMAERFCR